MKTLEWSHAMKIHELIAYLCLPDANDALLGLYKKAFVVQENFRLTEPNGRIGCTKLIFEGLTLMLAWSFLNSELTPHQR